MKSLRSRVLKKSFIAESMNPDKWWDKLKVKHRLMVCSILGLNNKVCRLKYADVDMASQDEISSYYRKHHGRVESVDDNKPLSVVENVDRLKKAIDDLYKASDTLTRALGEKKKGDE